eukprot:GHVU01140350.1.p1 GENE.GHVU01140350.1~~GHVU01140350.1.p1  ORF type:complete len:218 (-),score=35.11 GHVU01140350.1:1612-2265(-)
MIALPLFLMLFGYYLANWIEGVVALHAVVRNKGVVKLAIDEKQNKVVRQRKALVLIRTTKWAGIEKASAGQLDDLKTQLAALDPSFAKIELPPDYERPGVTSSPTSSPKSKPRGPPEARAKAPARGGSDDVALDVSSDEDSSDEDSSDEDSSDEDSSDEDTSPTANAAAKPPAKKHPAKKPPAPTKKPPAPAKKPPAPAKGPAKYPAKKPPAKPAPV